MEVWKPIPDYEGLYEASDEGQVRSLDRMVAQLGAKTKSIKGKTLRSHISTNKYLTVGLWKMGKQSHMLVHFAVASAFIGERPLGHQVCHNDGDRLNNEASNLRYDTVSENMRDTVRHGTSKIHLCSGFGEKNGNVKLMESEVVEIKRRISFGESLRAISNDYSQVTYSTIKRINQGKIWASVGALL